MPTRNQSHPVIYRAFNTLTGALQSGDVGNHQLAWSKDGVLATPTNAPQAITGWDGWYYFWTTNAEANCEVGELIGRSTTGSHIHIERSKYFYQLDVALTTAGLAAVRADGLNVNLLTGQTVALTPGYQTTLTTAIEAALLNEGDGQSLVEAIIQRIESDLDASDVSVQAMAVAFRDAILNRLLAGNHETAGSVGAQLLKIDALMLAADYVPPDNDVAEGALEAATSAAAGVVTLQQRLTAGRGTLMDNLANLDAPISSRAEPGDAMSLNGSALSFLGGRSIETVNPVGAGGRVDLVIGDDYSSQDGRQLRWIVTGAHASLATAEIILAVKQSSGAAIEFTGEVSTIDAEQGKYLISVNLDNVDTSELLAGWADYQLVAVIDGRRNTQLFGRTQQTPRLV